MKRIFVFVILIACSLKSMGQSGKWSEWKAASYPYATELSYRLKCGNYSKVSGDTEWFLEVKNATHNEYTLDAGVFPIGNNRLKKTVHGSLKPDGQFHTSYTLPVS